MAEVERKAPSGMFRVISVPFVGAAYRVRDWPSFNEAVTDADAMHAGPSYNEFFVYDDEGMMVYDPAK